MDTIELNLYLRLIVLGLGFVSICLGLLMINRSLSKINKTKIELDLSGQNDLQSEKLVLLTNEVVELKNIVYEEIEKKEKVRNKIRDRLQQNRKN